MTKYSLMDDYSEGCHPNILEALTSTNLTQQSAYGDDVYCERARELIANRCSQPDLPVHFVSGGTLANIIITSSTLRPHEAIVSAASGHIATHETGAIEAVGHKIISVPSIDGKLTPDLIELAVTQHTFAPHMAKPRMVYLSNATELGTVYTKKELGNISAFCKSNNLLLMLDGARLGVALASEHSELSFEDVARLTDIFWIGGTKAGALVGEAIVIPNKELAKDFSFHIKQRGALLAKGRMLGLQFTALFTDNLFDKLSLYANVLAAKLSRGIINKGHQLHSNTDCNQVFPILPNTAIGILQEQFQFHVWEKLNDTHSVVRLVTSWATDENQIDAFTRLLADAK